MSRAAAWRRLECFDAGPWLQVPRRFMEIFRTREANVFACLVNIYCMRLEGNQDKDGWIRLPNKTIMTRLPYARDRVQKAMACLRGRGVVRIKRRAAGVRWVKLDLDAFTALEANTTGRISPNTTGRIKSNASLRRRTVGEKNSSRGAPRVVRIKAIRVDHFRGFAEDLHEMVSKVRTVPTSSKPSTWAQSFRTLHRRGVPVERIAAALAWYRSTLREYGDLIRAGRTYVPIAYSGPRWLEKWEQLEQAMERGRADRGEATGPAMKVRMVRASGKKSGGTSYEDGW